MYNRQKQCIILEFQRNGDDILNTKRVAIIGGGASGLVCAIEAKSNNPALDIIIFEKLPKACKKILVTGNGRCNFTNEDLSPKHFYGDSDFLKSVLTSVYADSENYFRSLGVLSYREDGRLYPRSQQSSAIREALINKADSLNIKIKLEAPVSEIKKVNKSFYINNERFDTVVLCGGGKSSSVQGSDGSCYSLAESLGHTKTDLYPALCGLLVNEKINLLKGVRAECNVKLFSLNKLLGEENGEVQFTDNAISGIPVMNLSHLCKDNKDISLSLDLCDNIPFNELFEHIKSRPKTDEIESVLGGIINSKLGFTVMSKADIKPHTTLDNTTTNDIKKICETLKNFTLNIKGAKDFNTAQITCGGIKTDEINPKTMMSKNTEGLFLCGEILDIHGDCGGYNLHLAWTTGRIAGNSIAEYLK